MAVSLSILTFSREMLNQCEVSHTEVTAVQNVLHVLSLFSASEPAGVTCGVSSVSVVSPRLLDASS